ncbi:MAG: M1 family aminopeptidase, partial [Bacteroidota bacterium]
MWFQIFKFELQYRKKRPATYIYFGLLFLMAFLAISTDIVQIGGGAGLVKENAPATIAKMMVILSAFMMMITSAIMGVGVLRDFEHKAESMIFSTPISKFDYLFGRFLGSFVVTLFAFSGIILGFMFGEFVPWRDADKLLPFTLSNYLHPFIYFVIPNLFFSGVLFFFTGALSRKMVVVYVQWIFLFVLYQIAAILTGEIDNQSLAAIIDPFGYNTIEVTTQYWTVAEQNSMTIPITGNVLINRLLWLSVGVVFAVLGYMRFSFNVVQGKNKNRKAKADDGISNTLIDIPQAVQKLGWSTYWLQIWTQAKFYFKYIVKGIPFIAITLFGMAIVIINSFYIGEVFGTYTYPTTYLMLALINGGFTLFFLIILVFYSGELVWRERDVKIDLIQDSLPIPDFVNLVSKFLGLVMVFMVMLTGLMFFGILVQTFRGYYEYNIDVYITSLFTETLSALVLLSLLSFFVQVMVNNKFLGHAIMILLFISTLVMDNLGVEHSLFQFASADLGTYSEMNGFGHFVTSFSWFDLYWAAFSIFLFAIAVMFAVRGSEAAMKWRWAVGKLRLTRPLVTFGLTAFFVFTLSGCYIYYNTNVLNTYSNSDEQKAFQADYERKYNQYQYLPQPKVTDMSMQVELYPSDRDYSAEGSYVLKNYESEPIQEIHLQLEPRKDYTHEYVRFSKGVTVKEHDERFNYIIYTLDEPLQPEDTLTVSFKMVYQTTGFKESESNNEVVFNGTFINNGNFPSIGYNSGLELSSDDDRKDNDLEPKERLLPRNDPRGLARNFITDDSHGINFEIVIGTEADQIAVAPGYLQREWTEDDRKYFHYKMDQPMIPFFNVVSARYEVMKDVTTIMDDSVEKEISLEIYYHPGHEYNLESMMKGMKDSFKYFSENFSPYQYRQMRILEFPRYATFAQSFANTVPFSEGIGFMLEIEDEDDVDAAYFVTAHELAHQWWAHQVISADVRGSQVLSEALAQYSALMVMKQNYPQEHLKEFLREELDRYLRGRRTEQKKEQPLALVENQQYIHYGKGANVMFTFQDFIGEDSVNVALQRLIRDWRYFETNGRYSTTEDLMGYFRAVTPDSLQNLVTDLFE